MFKIQDDFYHWHIDKEILVNEEQKLKKEHFPETNFGFGDPDDNTDIESMNWISEGSFSGAEKTIELMKERIEREYSGRPYCDSKILINDGYVYYFYNHYLIKEVVLHREKLYFTKKASIDYDGSFLELIQSIANGEIQKEEQKNG